MNYWLKDCTWKKKAETAIKNFKYKISDDIIESLKNHLNVQLKDLSLEVDVWHSATGHITIAIKCGDENFLKWVDAPDFGFNKIKTTLEL